MKIRLDIGHPFFTDHDKRLREYRQQNNTDWPVTLKEQVESISKIYGYTVTDVHPYGYNVELEMNEKHYTMFMLQYGSANDIQQ